MTKRLQRFTVQLALKGISEKNSHEVLHDIEEELNARPHLLNPQVLWESKMRRLIIQVGVQDVRPDLAARQMAEELFEVACAVLLDVEGMHVEVLEER